MTENKLTRADSSDNVWRIAEEGAFTALGSEPSFEDLAAAIKQAMHGARKVAAAHVNAEQLAAYWNIGRMIVVYEQEGIDRAEYGNRTLATLSRRLTSEFGRGFSKTNLYNMRRFYLTHQIFQSVTGKLTWTHYCELMDIADDDKRRFYEREAENSHWSVRELRRQIDSMLFERLLNAKDGAGKERVLSLANEGAAIHNPADIIREPYVLEFLNLPDDKPVLERDLESALLRQIEKFMLELGRGFMFVGSYQRVPVSSDKDFVDMVFYNKPLHAYVLIELKTTKFLSSAVGQINEYLNYYAEEVNDEGDNPPIGIILCTDKNNVRAQYALGGLSNAIFASTYTLRLPNEEQLEEQVRRTIEANEHRLLGEGDAQ